MLKIWTSARDSNPVQGSWSRSVFKPGLPSFVFLNQQEQEGKKFMEPQSEDDHFEEVPVQQLSQVKHTHMYEN